MNWLWDWIKGKSVSCIHVNSEPTGSWWATGFSSYKKCTRGVWWGVEGMHDYKCSVRFSSNQLYSKQIVTMFLCIVSQSIMYKAFGVTRQTLTCTLNTSLVTSTFLYNYNLYVPTVYMYMWYTSSACSMSTIVYCWYGNGLGDYFMKWMLLCGLQTITLLNCWTGTFTEQGCVPVAHNNIVHS